MKWIVLLALTFNVYAQSLKSGKFDDITTNSPSKTTIDLKKDVDVQSTGGVYLPSGTTGQRPAPTKDGMLRYNSTTGTAEIYKSGTWGAVGGAISTWVTAKAYQVDDLVIESNKIYKCLLAHTSGTFATDLGAGDWVEVSKGTTTTGSATDNKVVRYDGATGELIQSSGVTVDDTNNITGIADLTVTGNTTLNTSLSGPVKATAGVLSASAINLTSDVSGVLPIANGGTGSNTQNFVDLTTAQTVAGDKNLTGTTTTAKVHVGDVGVEAGGINIDGTTYESTFKVSDINGTNYAQNILHRHSTTLEPVVLGARSNSNTSSHTDVTSGQNVLSIYGSGYAGSNYKLFNGINFSASTLGTISNTSSPGKITFLTTPDGSKIPTATLTLDSDKSATFAGAVSATNLSGTNTGDLTSKGQEDTVTTTTKTIHVPNYQETVIATDTKLIETGNTNILVNPDFEHSTAGYGWTISGATASADTTNQVTGKKALSLSISASTLSAYQNTLVNVSNTISLQAAASLYIKTALTNVQVCSMVAGAEDKCVDVVSNNGWKQVVIPFVFGATSNGIMIKTTSSTTGTVLVDNSFVGLSNPFQDVSNVGPEIAYTPTFTGFGTVSNVNIKYRQVGTNVHVVGTFTAGTTTATEYRMTLPNSYTAPSTLPTLSHVGEMLAASTNANNVGLSVLIEPSVGYVTFGVKWNGNAGISKTSSTAQVVTGTTYSINAMIPVSQLTNSAKLYSSASKDYDWTSYTPTYTGFGTVTGSSCYHKRKGSDLYIKCAFTSGTPTAIEARITLPNSVVPINLPVANSVTGRFTRNRTESSAYAGTVLINNSVNYFTFSHEQGANPMAAQLGTAFVNNNTPYYFETGPIAISGWQDYGTIVGSFSGVPDVPGGSGKIDTFAFSYGTTNATTVCSATPCSYLDQIGNSVISVTRSSAGVYVPNLAYTYSKLKCWGSVGSPTAYLSMGGGTPASCSNCNTVTIQTGSGGSSADSFGSINCMGTR